MYMRNLFLFIGVICFILCEVILENYAKTMDFMEEQKSMIKDYQKKRSILAKVRGHIKLLVLCFIPIFNVILVCITFSAKKKIIEKVKRNIYEMV